jgi:hypothetical protein
VGTNYYLHLPRRNECDHCKRADPPEEIHIGKHSGGWKFGFHPRFHSWKEWHDFICSHLATAKIKDEYDQVVNFATFVWIVEEAQKGIWIYDERNPDNSRFRKDLKYEFLDPRGYRIINATEFF